ncbi:MAG: serine/threonine-protein phosphatase [Flavobacteriales bacterium]|nr:serine/threonine-protein phosphatase [Flavobacteriales bacterium]
MKKYFASTSRKVLLLLYGASLLIGAAIIIRSHQGEKEALQEQTMARLAGVTGTLSAQLDGGRITRLLKTYDSRGMLVKNTQDAWYYVQHGALQKSADAAGLTTPLLIVAYDANKQELQTVITSAARPELRNAYTGPGAKEITHYLQRNDGKAMRITSTAELVAVDAVHDGQGRIVAALVAHSPLALLRSDSNAQLIREVGFVALLFVLIGLLLFRRVGRLVRHEEEERNDLQVRHDGITDSIAYAGKIQSALIPSPERFREQFDDFFVLNRPRDVVSGDFHWYHRISEHECLVAAADCTGHGLPGAMMAAIACSLLNDLVRDRPEDDPAEILAELNRRLIRTLNQEGRRSGAGDGLDIALCRIDRKDHEILFAGAFRPLYWMHKGQLTVINGDRKPVGGSQHGADRKFSVHRIAYHPGDSIYLFSDGYVDQFGGPERKKFMTTRFSEILLANHRMPMAMQAEALEEAFLEWKGTQPQVDDVCVLGIAV